MRPCFFPIEDILSSDIPIRWEDGGYLIYLIFGNAASGSYCGGGESIVHPNGFYVPSQDIENRFRQRFGDSSPVFCFIGVYSNEKVIIIQKEQIGNQGNRLLSQKLYDLAGELEKEYKYSVTVSYLPIDKTDINTRINLCRKLAVQNILLGVNNVVSDASGSGHSTQNLNDLISYFSLYLRQTQLDSLKTKVHNLFAGWYEDRYPLAAIQNDLIYITNSLKHSMPQNLSIPENHEYTIAYYIDAIAAVSNDHSDFADNYYYLLLELFTMPFSDGNVMSAAQLVERIEGYFHNNISNHITLSMLCSEMNYSKVHLCRIFKKLKHTTPIGYFIQLKIEKAQSIIKECPALTLADIADSLGFKDVYYFSKVFKRVTGQTPSAVRELVRRS
jgi:AraC-like DNA-binding protein